MEYGGLPMPGTPFGGMGAYPGQFGASADVGPNFWQYSSTQQFAPALESQLQSINSRVQKLERTRGQMSKDIAEMLNETRELRKKVSANGVPPRIPGVPQDHPENGPLGLQRRAARTKTAPPAALSSVLGDDAHEPQTPQQLEVPISPPPGLSLPPKVAAPMDSPPQVKDSLSVQVKELADGTRCSRVEWRIDNVRVKLKDCIGRPLVSPIFDAPGLSDLRLMVAPNLGFDVGGLTMREQKARYEAKVALGPLTGTLKFKVVPTSGDHLCVKFNLFVGSVSKGPLEHDFAHHIIHGAEFDNDWLDQMSRGSLVVGVEVLHVEQGPS